MDLCEVINRLRYLTRACSGARLLLLLPTDCTGYRYKITNDGHLHSVGPFPELIKTSRATWLPPKWRHHARCPMSMRRSPWVSWMPF